MFKDPRCLVLDIETAPMEVYVWHRKDQTISIEQIKKDWFILAFSAKWLNEPVSTIRYYDTRGKAWGNDKSLLKVVWKLLDEADIVVTQNGERFDSRKLNARFILSGMGPPSPYKHLDTFKILSRVAEFTSASLEYLTEHINKKYKKLKHKRYPGWKLWKECLNNNKDAWAEMRRYNINDVLSTEELYLNTKAWAPANAPKLFLAKSLCGRCGASNSLVKWGFYRINRGVYQRYNCHKCGAWSAGKERLNER